MKTQISSFLLLLSLLMFSLATDTLAQMQETLDLRDLVYKDLDNISDRICCYTGICFESERPDNCSPRVSDASLCGECKNVRTGEVGIYTQDLNEPRPDTTLADAFGNLIMHNSKIRNEITNTTTKLTKIRKSMRSFETKALLNSSKPTKNEKKKYEAALKSADIYEADLAILQQLQAAIYKLSSDLFLLTLSNKYRKVE